MLKKILKPASNLMRLYSKLKSFKVASILTPVSNTPQFHEQTNVTKRDNTYYFKPYDFSVPSAMLPLFNKFPGCLESYIKSKKITFNDKVVTIRQKEADIKIEITSADNLKAIEEVFLKDSYPMNFQDSNYLVLDIGLNIGTASLLFASKSWVDIVIGYEPFLSTFQQAEKNVALNEDLSKKIFLKNYGISDADKSISGQIAEGGGLGSSANFEADENGISEKINLKNIATELEEIHSSYPDKKVVLKIDCEGEEYVIIDKLNESGWLQKISVIMLEFHFKGKDSIIETLESNGFITVSPYATFEDFGMVYAFRV